MPPTLVAASPFDASLVALVARKGGRIRPRALKQSNPRKYPTSLAAERALQRLRDAGLGTWDVDGPSPRGGPATRVFVLKIHAHATRNALSPVPGGTGGQNFHRARDADRVLGPSTRSVLLDRLDAAVEDGRLDLVGGDGRPVVRLEVTLGELGLIQQILFPEEYGEPVEAALPTRTAPGGDARIAEYARRVAAGEVLFLAADATADGPGRGLRVTQRANGTGFKVLGWEDADGSD